MIWCLNTFFHHTCFFFYQTEIILKIHKKMIKYICMIFKNNIPCQQRAWKISLSIVCHYLEPSNVLVGIFSSVQFSSVAQSCPTLCNPMNRSTPGLPVHHQLPEFTQTHLHRVSDAIQPSHPLSSPSPPVPNPSQHQSLFQWVNSSCDVAKALELQLQHQSF